MVAQVQVCSWVTSSLELFKQVYLSGCNSSRREGRGGPRPVGTFCLYVPGKFIFAARADRVIMSRGRNSTMAVAEGVKRVGLRAEVAFDSGVAKSVGMRKASES
jgi:hypothetical protein